MGFYADLHIHSKYSRATSRDCDLENLALWAKRKGITVVGTGDFTHPAWFDEIKEKLIPAEPGLFRLREEVEREIDRRVPPACRAPVRFMLSVEISTIYKKGEKTRKVHHLIYTPDLEIAGRFRNRLDRIGNIKSDGRPILGLDSRHLLEIALESGEGAYLVPAHIWTPWFAVLGSKSGFDRVEECYGDLASHIFAVETGLSSDPPMNWQVSSLDRYRLVSNSDAHSPPMLGREACSFDSDLDYFAMRRALETGEGYGGTVEFFPEEGKYHLDGHRKCGVRLEPEETQALDGKCPVCHKPLTLGVAYRVASLSDRTTGEAPATAAPFRSLVPLPEIVGEIRRVGPKSKGVSRDVNVLYEQLGPELRILDDVPVEDIRRAGSTLVAEAIDRLRRGDVVREAGYDGEYGKIRMFQRDEVGSKRVTGSLFGESPPGPVPVSAERSAEPRPPVPAPPPAAHEPESVRLPPSRPEGSPDVSSESSAPTSRFLASLDEDQRAAARAQLGPLLIVAGPGTGKTRTITHRFAHLVDHHGVAPEHCLAITFTRRAAREMRERLEQLLGARAEPITVTTFHGFGLRFLREQREAMGLHRGFRVADEAEQQALVQDTLQVRRKEVLPFLARVGQERRDRALSGPGDAPAPVSDELARYQRALSERNWIDFDELIARPVEHLSQHQEIRDLYRARYRWVAVDEYQDIDALQYRLVRLLCAADGNLCAVGDPDQAIYRFRGADVAHFLRFEQDFPSLQRVTLTRNYRSTSTIVDGALQGIAPATLVKGRTLLAVGEPSGSAPSRKPNRIVVHRAPTEAAEAEFVVHSVEQFIGGHSYFSIDSGRADTHSGEDLSFSDFGVLYRTDAQAAALVQAFERSGVPFQKRSHERLLDRPCVRGLVDALQAADPSSPGETRVPERGGSVLHQLERAVRKMQSQNSDADEHRAMEGALELLRPFAERYAEDLLAFRDALSLGVEVDGWDPRADRVSLLTLHAAKGLEFEVVFFVGCEEGLVPFAFGDGPLPAEELDEERRLFFVGMTRARRRLLFSHAAKRRRFGRSQSRTPSRFLSDIEQALLEARTSDHATRVPKRPRADQLPLF